MPITPKALTMQVGRMITERILALAFAGNYPTGGDTLDLTAISEALNRIDGFKNFKFDGIKVMYPVSESGGYYFEIIKGTTLANNKVKIYKPAGTELDAGAYPAALLAPPQNESFALGIQSIGGK